MAVLHEVLGICLLFTVVLVDNKGNSMSTSSPAVIANGSAIQNHSSMVQNLTSTAHVNPSSMSINKTATMTIKPSQNKTFTPSHMTFTPSHNVTVTSLHSMTVTPSHNMTVTPSHNMTVTPSHNMTVTPSHNMTVTPSHNMTVTPSHNMTVTPSHNMTVTPSHNMTVTPSHNMTVTPSQTMPTPPVTPTPTPTSTPIHPKPGNFTVTTKNNTVCLFAYMAARFDVTMNFSKHSVYLPADATATGACDNYPSNNKSYITLSWQSKEVSYNFTMHFVIVKGNSDQFTSSPGWAAANLTFSMKTPGFSETFQSTKEPLNEVSAPLGYAYLCKTSVKDIKLTAVNSSVDVSLMDVKFQPFEVDNGKLSANADYCVSTEAPASAFVHPTTKTPTKPHKESHTVAIAVGCTLAGLVVIVAIGYLIGRRYRRNTSAGYRKL
ncbi:uncharacterized protein [Porites lutea]|uniref:uncharacterized protein n=1 Tax=Porites lutea TaxID=51062 RepID=UPI003CC58890